MTQYKIRGGTVKQSIPYEPGYVPAPNYDQMEANSNQAMANAKQSFEAIQRTMEMQHEMESIRSKNKAEDDLKVLADYSGILKSSLEAWEKKRKEDEKLEAINLAHQTMATLQQQAQYGKELGLAEANHNTQSRFAAAAGAKGASFDQAELIRQLDGTWKGVHYVRELYKLFQEDYGASVLREFQGGNGTFVVPRNGEMVEIKASEAQGRAERLAVMEQFRSAQFKKWGIHYTDEAMVQNELSPAIREIEGKFHAGMEKQDVVNRTAQAIDDAQRIFAYGKRDLSQLYTDVLAAHLGNRQEAWKTVQKYYVDMLESGLMTPEQAQEDWMQNSWRDGSKSVAGDFTNRYAVIAGAIKKAKDRLLQEKFNNDRIGMQNYRAQAAQMAQQRKEAGTDTTDWWESLNNNYRNMYPGYGDLPEYSDAIKAGRTVEGRELAARKSELKSLAANRMLRPHHLVTDDEKLAYMDQAKGFEKAAIATEGYKEQLGQLKAYAGASNMFKFQKDGKLSREGRQWVIQAQRLFMQTVSNLERDKPELANYPERLADTAIKSTFDEIARLQKIEGKVFYKDETTGKFPNLYGGAAVTTAETAQLKRQETLQAIKDYGTEALVTPDVLMTEDQYRASRANFGQPGWRLPTVITSYAHEYNKDAWDLYNDLGEGFGGGLFPRIKLSKDDEKIKQGLTLEEKFLLGSTRPAPRLRGIMQVDRRMSNNPDEEIQYKLGFVQNGVNPVYDQKVDYIPLGLGKDIQSASKKYRVDPAIIAGLITQESSWNPNAYNKGSGAMGLGQFLQGTAQDMGIDPWDPKQAVYGAAKYLRWAMDFMGTDNIELGLYAYNSGPGRVGTLIDKYGEIGALRFLRDITKNNQENQQYVPKILKHSCKYGGGARACNNPTTMRSGFIEATKKNNVLKTAFPGWAVFAEESWGNQ